MVKQIRTQQHKVKQQFTVHEGVDSYRNYWLNAMDRFPEGTIDYCVGAPANDEWKEIVGAEFYEKIIKKREEKKFFWKTIHFKITESEKWMLQRYPEITEYRLWPRDVKCKGNFNVIHDTVILLSAVDPLKIIEIRDETMVEVFRNYFDMMWEKSEKVEI